jgi:membrane protease subunit (stomatin/prohibitin family)
MTMSAMATVHEQMHQRTDQDQQKRPGAKDVCPVLGQQKECRDRTHHHQANAIA